jgi:predicted phage baseplate assembly protein
MALPTPNLDDRRFQDLVDDCKRLVQQRCPEWTDHNVHDPGVTLLETFAWLADQLLYRLNRVPDKNYVKFLELVGVRLFPPNAARAGVTFWLSAPRPDTVRIPTGTRVATPRAGSEELVAFTTLDDVDAVPCRVAHVLSSVAEGAYRHHDDALGLEQEFACFDQVPKPGDSLLVGLDNAVPSCAVVVRFDARIEGIGVDPDRPPLAWEAWDGEGWAACQLDTDTTGGINRAGDVVLHVPASHTAAIVDRLRAGWLRARVLEAEEDQPAYSASPSVRRLSAFTIGATTPAVNAEVVEDEVLGFSDGTPGQCFWVSRPPIVPVGDPVVVDVAGDDWEPWEEVGDWASSGPADAHFLVDRVSGEVRFGPAVRQPDGALTSYGRVPPKGAAVRIRSYRTGGGQRGNVARRSLTVLKSSIPFVARVENRAAASGGRDGETVDNAKERGPITLRSRGRAVTAEDFEYIAGQAALEVARTRCAPVTDGDGGSGVRLLIVPHATDDRGRLSFGQMVPADETYQKVAAALDERRTVGTRVVVEPPEYMGVTVVARLRSHPSANPARLREAALEALFRYFHPLRGGPDGDGWPFGRPVHVGEVYAVLQGLPGLGIIEDARLFTANPATIERGRDAVPRIDLEPNQLVFSVDHQVVLR